MNLELLPTQANAVAAVITGLSMIVVSHDLRLSDYLIYKSKRVAGIYSATIALSMAVLAFGCVWELTRPFMLIPPKTTWFDCAMGFGFAGIMASAAWWKPYNYTPDPERLHRSERKQMERDCLR